MAIFSTSITAALLAGSFRTIGSKLADSGVKLLGGRVNKILEYFNNSKISEAYLKKAVYKIFVFRTITKGDRDVYLDEIYHPLNMSKGTKRGGRKINIGDKAKIQGDGCSLIIGLAGQGKTTIMRKLFLEEVVRKEKLPFFITLRQHDYESNRCEDILLEHLTTNGIECELDDVVGILKTKKVIFFWDGFDEIVSSQRNKALSMIVSVHDKYGCSSIVTTRPDTEITRQPGVNTYTVNYLTSEDVSEMVVKIVDNNEVSESILSTLDKKIFLQQTIKTPILVDVLIVTSSSLGDNPRSIADYYNHLFSALMFRHDLNKNYSREKKSSLSNQILEECFSFFSFLSLMESKSDFTSEFMLSYYKKTRVAKKIDVPEACISSDIVDGTNLIVRDGYDNYVYIHRSIQEYFSAKCIAQFSLEQKSMFLSKYANFDYTKKNTNMLEMLSYIDPVDFYKRYLIPFLENKKVIVSNKIIVKSKSQIEEMIGNWVIGVSFEDSYEIRVLSQKGVKRNEISHYFMGLGHAAGLRGINIDSQMVTMYIFSKSAGDILNCIKEGAVKTFKRTEENSYGSDLDWVRIFDVKHAIKNYDKSVIEPFYENYINTVNFVQEFIDEEYVRKIESVSAVTEMLNEMGY
ncbi:TPA: NACHT domain-containing protein [Serratia fonticola]|nr:NACHT domain-containing protein [Serratia fonticola]